MEKKNVNIELTKALESTVVNLFFNSSPSTGLLTSIMRNVECGFTDDITTAAAVTIEDKNYILFNEKLFIELNLQERVTLLAHELYHILLMHSFVAREFKDKTIFNIAADHVINLLLEKDGFIFTNFLSTGCKNPKYKDWSIKQIYDDLLQKKKQKEENKEEENKEEENKEEENKEEENKEEENKEEENKEEENKEEENKEEENKEEENIFCNDLKPISDDKYKHLLNQNIIQTLETVQTHINNNPKSLGNLPVDLVTWLDKVTQPKINWVNALHKLLTGFNEKDYSYKNIRRTSPENIPLRGYNIHEPSLDTINIYWDTSGSISDKDINLINSEIKYIKELYNPTSLNIITFDTKIQKVISISDMDDYTITNVQGRGGTSLKEVYKHIKKTRPEITIIFTDLDVHIPTECPTRTLLWICTDPFNKRKPPYGTYLSF